MFRVVFFVGTAVGLRSVYFPDGQPAAKKIKVEHIKQDLMVKTESDAREFHFQQRNPFAVAKDEHFWMKPEVKPKCEMKLENSATGMEDARAEMRCLVQRQPSFEAAGQYDLQIEVDAAQSLSAVGRQEIIPPPPGIVHFDEEEQDEGQERESGEHPAILSILDNSISLEIAPVCAEVVRSPNVMIESSGAGGIAVVRGRCMHGKRYKSACKICKPCPHGKVKEQCKDCNGCEHGKVKRDCTQCNKCEHGKRKWDCKDCNGAR